MKSTARTEDGVGVVLASQREYGKLLYRVSGRDFLGWYPESDLTVLSNVCPACGEGALLPYDPSSQTYGDPSDPKTQTIAPDITIPVQRPKSKCPVCGEEYSKEKAEEVHSNPIGEMATSVASKSSGEGADLAKYLFSGDAVGDTVNFWKAMGNPELPHVPHDPQDVQNDDGSISLHCPECGVTSPRSFPTPGQAEVAGTSHKMEMDGKGSDPSWTVAKKDDDDSLTDLFTDNPNDPSGQHQKLDKGQADEAKQILDLFSARTLGNAFTDKVKDIVNPQPDSAPARNPDWPGESNEMKDFWGTTDPNGPDPTESSRRYAENNPPANEIDSDDYRIGYVDGRDWGTDQGSGWSDAAAKAAIQDMFGSDDFSGPSQSDYEAGFLDGAHAAKPKPSEGQIDRGAGRYAHDMVNDLATGQVPKHPTAQDKEDAQGIGDLMGDMENDAQTYVESPSKAYQKAHPAARYADDSTVPAKDDEESEDDKAWDATFHNYDTPLPDKKIRPAASWKRQGVAKAYEKDGKHGWKCADCNLGIAVADKSEAKRKATNHNNWHHKNDLQERRASRNTWGAYLDLLEADPMARFAAWRDVRSKALRLRKEGKVYVRDYNKELIVGRVTGDTNTYDCEVSRLGGFGLGESSVSGWDCECEWAKYAFDRRTFTGRMCSHALAMYYEMQSRATRHLPETPVQGPQIGSDYFQDIVQRREVDPRWSRRSIKNLLPGDVDLFDPMNLGDPGDTKQQQEDADKKKESAQKFPPLGQSDFSNTDDPEFDKGYYDATMQRDPSDDASPAYMKGWQKGFGDGADGDQKYDEYQEEQPGYLSPAEMYDGPDEDEPGAYDDMDDREFTGRRLAIVDTDQAADSPDNLYGAGFAAGTKGTEPPDDMKTNTDYMSGYNQARLMYGTGAGGVASPIPSTQSFFVHMADEPGAAAPMPGMSDPASMSGAPLNTVPTPGDSASAAPMAAPASDMSGGGMSGQDPAGQSSPVESDPNNVAPNSQVDTPPDEGPVTLPPPQTQASRMAGQYEDGYQKGHQEAGSGSERPDKGASIRGDYGIGYSDGVTDYYTSPKGKDMLKDRSAGDGYTAGRNGLEYLLEGMPRVARKDYTPAEQLELINEGEGLTASNFASLNLEGTHYLDEADPLSDVMFL